MSNDNNMNATTTNNNTNSTPTNSSCSYNNNNNNSTPQDHQHHENNHLSKWSFQPFCVTTTTTTTTRKAPTSTTIARCLVVWIGTIFYSFLAFVWNEQQQFIQHQSYEQQQQLYNQQQQQPQTTTKVSSSNSYNNNDKQQTKKRIRIQQQTQTQPQQLSSSCLKSRSRMVYPSMPDDSSGIQPLTFCYYERELDQTHPTESQKENSNNNVLGNHNRPYCRFYYGMDIDLQCITFHKYGGESMDSVLGQDETHEYFQYKTIIIDDKNDGIENFAFHIHTQQKERRNETVSYTNDVLTPLKQNINQVNKYHYIADVIQNTMIVKQEEYVNNKEQQHECTERVPGMTFMIQRYEYVNLYHTMTDWWNTWLSFDSIFVHQQQQQQQQQQLSSTTNSTIETRIVFLDSHPAGLLDDTWNVLFGNTTTNEQTNKNNNNHNSLFDSHDGTTDYTVHGENYTYLGQYYVKHQTKNRLNKKKKNIRICFDDVILVPPGYLSESFLEWNKGGSQGFCQDTIVTERFVNFVLQRFGLLQRQQDHNVNEQQQQQAISYNDVIPMKPYHIVLIDRRPYISHPRAKANNFQRIITNLDVVAETIQTHFLSSTGINVTYEIVQLDRYTMYEQIVKVRSAHILLGYHGAGLTHLLFLHQQTSTTPGATVMEIQNESNGLFVKLARWKRVNHIMLPSLYAPTMSSNYITTNVIPHIEKIFQSYHDSKRTHSSL